MARLPDRLKTWTALAVLALGALAQPGHADMPGAIAAEPAAASTIGDATAFLDQAENLQRKDHPRFVQMLARLHREAPPLTPRDAWRLRYLDAWEVMFQGNYAKSEQELHDIIEHAGDDAIRLRASSLLLMNLGWNQRYEEAFTLANRLASELPAIKDPMTRFLVLMNLSQMLDLAGQTDLAIKYARMMDEAIPSGENRCLPLNLLVAALYNGKRLHSASPEVQAGIDACTDAQQPVATNSIRLVLGSLFIDEKQPAKAMALLDHVAPTIELNRFYPHMLSAQAERAQAQAMLGNDGEARKAGLAAIAMAHQGEISEWLMVAYEVLYQVEKRQGHAAAALAYHEQYAAQDKGYLNDVSARTLAYEMAQQHLHVQRLETESLAKQNSILRLQQALNTKAVETSRLYIAMLLLLLVSIVFWLFRIKRSQLRFKKLSCVDGLTGILNHQTFIADADRALHLLDKKHGTACLMFIDLDHFKQINDTHGHAVGDDMLKHVVSLCQPLLRSSDLFGRLGGEEFGILLLDCGREQGLMLAERVRRTIEATPAGAGDQVVALSASIGMAVTTTSGYAMQPLCRDADAALYRAKRSGRNRVVADGDAATDAKVA
ncbi:GGDEF domain-containing protein [Dyella sp. SG609]|uniref:GGDEF domain-containing protein n=1 Tax=Dyella sp. SG609 TaxID=2587018 RepID=UPI0017F80054|nr:GGDEF domain-containing protein [Dyella sp. SG609]NKJ22618.1 diguanylate cyclase (GGDEF)-like protein [Dyella sp. SG609]